MYLTKMMLIGLLLIACIGIIILVLLQHGKGADAGAGFGGSSSGGGANSLFGARGTASFLSRLTSIFATLFFATTLGLSALSAYKPTVDNTLIDQLSNKPAQKPIATPAAPNNVPK